MKKLAQFGIPNKSGIQRKPISNIYCDHIKNYDPELIFEKSYDLIAFVVHLVLFPLFSDMPISTTSYTSD